MAVAETEVDAGELSVAIEVSIDPSGGTRGDSTKKYIIVEGYDTTYIALHTSNACSLPVP